MLARCRSTVFSGAAGYPVMRATVRVVSAQEYEDYIEYDDGYDDQDDLALDTPEDFQIISQTLRRGPGGQQVVDIVIQVEDIAGATNYEIQVTKV